MRSRELLAGLVVGIVMGGCFLAAVVLAGELVPIAGPTEAVSQMYTLEQIYERLNAGTAGSKKTSFTEPSTGTAATGRTLDEIMGKLPALDDANGAGPGNVTQGKTYWGLTSGQWGMKTGTMATPVDTDLAPENIKQGVNIFGVVGTYPLAGVPKTGQTTSYATGDDGIFKKGVAWPNPRFTDNDNGTVTDNLTGLIWLKNANCFGERTWLQALSDANTLANGNFNLSDGSTAGQWRLPNVREMQSLVHYGFSRPALSNTAGTANWVEGDPFTGVQSGGYWLSTTFADLTSYAWFVQLDHGYVSSDVKSWPYYVWPVRGGQGR